MSSLVNEQNFEKQFKRQMSCMTGFLQLFDRHRILTGRRHRSARRLPLSSSSQVVDTASESEKSVPSSPAVAKEIGNRKQFPERTPEEEEVVNLLPPKSRLPFPIFELREAAKNSPRLSLDSRATTDAKGRLHPKEVRTGGSILPTHNRCESVSSDATDDSLHHRSPSVVARLMGLEPLQDSPELRRSASESRVSRDLFQTRLVSEESNFYSQFVLNPALDAGYADPRSYLWKNGSKLEPPKCLNRGSGFNSPSPWRVPQHRRSFVDYGDFFPEPKVRGIDAPSSDLETLKQILEALQLKGLLHSAKPLANNHENHRNFVYQDSTIPVVKPSRSSNPTTPNRRIVNDYSPSSGRNQIRTPPPPRRNHSVSGEYSPSVSPSRERSVRSPSHSPIPTVTRRSNTVVKPKPLTVETQRQSTENRKTSPVHSPKVNARRNKPHPTVNNRSPRNKKAMASINQKERISTVGLEDESSSISGSSITTSTDTERSKSEDYKEGRNLLERCGKLLHSIAEITSTDMQSSPVSVLDPSFHKDELSTPSPVTTRRNINFQDQSGDMEDEIWSPELSPIPSKCKEILDNPEHAYIFDILKASYYLPEDSDVFQLLEKQQYLQGNDTSKVSHLQRKLIFDTIREILDRNQRVPPWKAAISRTGNKPSLDMVWSEFQRIREHNTPTEDLFETICAVLKKDLDMDDITGWGYNPVELPNMILDIERLIFKDLISDTIRDLASVSSSSLSSRRSTSMMMPRRKLFI